MPNQHPESEHKFVLSPANAVSFLRALDPHMTPLSYDPAHPDAWTRTTYLDTDDFAYLRSSATRTHRRLRVREYAAASAGNAPRLTGACFVELKENTGTLRSKIRCAAPAEDIAALLRGEIPGGSRLTSRSNAAWIALLKRIIDEQPRPRVTTWYRRDTLLAESGRVRVTVDAGFAVCAPVAPGAPGTPATPATILESLDATIVEVKLAGEKPEWLSRAMETVEEAHGFSKFRRAMEVIAAVPSRGRAR